MALNDLNIAGVDEKEANYSTPAGEGDWYWWSDPVKIQQTADFVKSNPAPWFGVMWGGYAGGDSHFKLFPLQKEPSTVKELATGMGQKAPYVAGVSEEGYVSYIDKNALAALLAAQVQDPEGDPEPFQTAEAFKSPMDLPDWEQLSELYSQNDYDPDFDETTASADKTAAPGEMSEGVEPAQIDEINEETMRSEDQIYRELEAEGRQDQENYEPADNEPAPDEETTESIISHLSNVLQDSSMQQEDRLLRAYAELGQFLENQGKIPTHNASDEKVAAGSDFARKQELMTPDGYEIESYNPYADPAQARRFTVWPPAGNAVGDYSSLEEANSAIEQWKQSGDPELLKRDGGAQFKVHQPRQFGNPEALKASDKTAGPINVDNPEQAFRDNPDKYLVHVAGDALKHLMGGQRHSYTKSGPSHEALAKVLTTGGFQFPANDMFALGYDDVSFEVPDQETAKKVVDFLNVTLPRSNDAQGYGYGTAQPAQAVAYAQTSDQHEGDEYSSPAEWVYPQSEL
jgi:hypothetical protein